MLGIAYGMTLQLLVIVDNYSAFVSKEAGLGREDWRDKRLAAQYKLEVQYDPSSYFLWVLKASLAKQV